MLRMSQIIKGRCVFHYLLSNLLSPLCCTDIECGGGFYVRSLVDDRSGQRWALFVTINKNINVSCLWICHCAAALSSCAHVKSLTRTKQGQFTLEEHVLREDHWTLENVLRVLQPCPGPEHIAAAKQLKKWQPATTESTWLTVKPTLNMSLWPVKLDHIKKWVTNWFM